MRLLRHVLAAFLLPLLALSCSNRDKVAQSSALSTQALAINEDLKALRLEAEAIRDATGHVLLSDPSKTSPSDERYTSFRGGMVFSCPAEADYCLLSTGATPPGKAVTDKLDHLRTLLPSLIGARQRRPDIDLGWMVTRESLGVTHPRFDIVTFLPAGMDFSRELVQFTRTSPALDPERKPVWFSPYIDMAGKGYVFTVAAPVYVGETHEAVAAIDVSVKRFAAKYFADDAGFLLLVDGEGTVVAATEKAKAALSLKVMGRYDYLELVRERVPLPAEYRLSSHPDPAVKKLSEFAAGKIGEKCLDVAGKPMAVASAPITEAGWLLLELDPMGC